MKGKGKMIQDRNFSATLSL